MSFTGFPARHQGVRSSLKGVQFPSSPKNRIVQSPSTPQSLRKFSLAGYAENRNPNPAVEKYSNDFQRSLHRSQKLSNRSEKGFEVSDGGQKSFNGQEKLSNGFQKSANRSQRPSKVPESGVHSCSSRKSGVQSTSGPRKNTVQVPASTQLLRKNQYHENDTRRFSLVGFEKSTNGSLKPSKVSESGIHACKSRCGVNYSEWAYHNSKPQPGKFLVAKRIEKPNQESTEWKCCKKKSKSGSLDTSADADRNRVCVASQKLRVSQEFMKDNFSETKKPSAKVGETSVEIQIGVQEHACGLSSIEDSKDGFSKMCGNSEKDESVELEISTMNDNIVGSEFSELCKRDIFSNDTLPTLGMSDGEENRLSIRTPDIIGISDPKNENLNQTMHDLEDPELNKNSISEDCNSNAIMLVSPQMDSKGNDEQIRTSGQKNGNMDEKIMEGAEEYSSATLLSSPWKGVSPALRRPLQAETLDNFPMCVVGKVKHLVKAFESLLPLSDRGDIMGPQAHCSLKKIAGGMDAADQMLSLGSMQSHLHVPLHASSMKELLNNKVTSDEIMQGIMVEAESGTPCPIKMTRIELVGDIASSKVEQVKPVDDTEDSLRVEHAHTGTSLDSRRQVKRDDDAQDSPRVERVYTHASVDSSRHSLDSTGRGSLDRSGIQQWKKQPKVTCAQPFKLRTEQRGQKKEKEFLKKVQVMFSEEQKNRIPMAQGLPWTTDQPQHLVKPAVKECTKPLNVKLYTEKRAADRAEFDQTMAVKINELEQKRLEEKRLQELAEEEEIKRLRKEMIPRAQLMPFFYRPFIHQRSSKSRSIPKEPKPHVLRHRRAKCIPCN